MATVVNERPLFMAQASGKDVVVSGITRFDLAETLDCGQAFRWKEDAAGRWYGVAFGMPLCIYRIGEHIVFADTTLSDFERIWRQYFDLDRDYDLIYRAVSSDATLKRIFEFVGGLRLLRQEPWEALCSFIISQNNNIPRIKGIIERLCETFGEPLSSGEYAFPSAETVAGLSLDNLAILRSGFRAKYILDAARRVASGETYLGSLSHIPLQQARETLIKIKGVGPKVADCALLFGCGRMECFPADVWIKRAMKTLFGGTLPDCAQPYAGIVQQYIFHYARMTKLKI